MIIKEANNNKKLFIKRVFFITQYFPPDYAPTGILIKELISKLNYKEIIIYTGKPSYTNLGDKRINLFKKFKNAKIYRTNLTNFWPKHLNGRIVNSILFTINRFIKLLINTNKNDLLIFTSEPPFLNLISFLISLLKKTPYILIIFDIYPELLTKISFLKDKWLITKLWRFLNKLSFNYSSEIIVLNEEMKYKISSLYNIKPEKVSVVCTWTDVDTIKNIPRNKNWFIKKYNLENKFIIMYSGNQGRGHDFKTIIETAYKLKNFEEIVFIFIGNGQQNNYLNEEITRLNLKNCMLVPYQKQNHLSYSLSAAHVSIVTLKKELHGLIAPSKLYGYFSASIPVIVISPENSYLRNIIEETNSGKWFLNNDSNKMAEWIIQAKSEKNKLNNMGRNGRDFVLKNASASICINQYKEILDKFNIL